MEFDKRRFFQTLLDAPPEQPLLETPEHSEYLQTHVFDKLSADMPLALTELDWNAFALQNVIPKDYHVQFGWMHQGWLCGVNGILRKVPAANLSEKKFF